MGDATPNVTITHTSFAFLAWRRGTAAATGNKRGIISDEDRDDDDTASRRSDDWGSETSGERKRKASKRPRAAIGFTQPASGIDDDNGGAAGGTRPAMSAAAAAVGDDGNDIDEGPAPTFRPPLALMPPAAADPPIAARAPVHRHSSHGVDSLRRNAAAAAAAAAVAGPPVAEAAAEDARNNDDQPDGAAPEAAPAGGVDMFEERRRADAARIRNAAMAMGGGGAPPPDDGGGGGGGGAGGDDPNDMRHYKPYTPVDWGPPAINMLPEGHRLLEVKADQRNPPFCFMCQYTESQSTRRDSSEYKKLVKYVTDHMLRMGRPRLCMDVQLRYLKFIVPLLDDDDEDGDDEEKEDEDDDNAEEKDGEDDDDGQRGAAGDAPLSAATAAFFTPDADEKKLTFEMLGERAGKRYWSLRQIYDHFRFHAPSISYILADTMRAINLHHESLMTGAIFLRHENNRNSVIDLKSMKAHMTILKDRCKYAMMLSAVQPDTYI